MADLVDKGDVAGPGTPPARSSGDCWSASWSEAIALYASRWARSSRARCSRRHSTQGRRSARRVCERPVPHELLEQGRRARGNFAGTQRDGTWLVIGYVNHDRRRATRWPRRLRCRSSPARRAAARRSGIRRSRSSSARSAAPNRRQSSMPTARSSSTISSRRCAGSATTRAAGRRTSARCKCQSCNAISVLDPKRQAQNCEFCGSAQLVPYEETKPRVPPGERAAVQGERDRSARRAFARGTASCGSRRRRSSARR